MQRLTHLLPKGLVLAPRLPFQHIAMPCLHLTRHFAQHSEPTGFVKHASQVMQPSEAQPLAPHPSSTMLGGKPAASTDKAGAQGNTSERSYMLFHPVYTKEYVNSIKVTHKPPVKLYEKLGYWGVQALRGTFDFLTGYGKNMNEKKWLTRMLYLETVAGVPGMVGAMLRHMRSLRTMNRDQGYIHTLLEEAENERMHLLTFLQLKQPSSLFRMMVLLGQGVFFNGFLAAYLISPRTCHAFVGYLEEEATKTYTKVIEDLDAGKLPLWSKTPVPQIALNYWRLPEDSTMRDMFLAIRADEAGHRHVNHTFSELQQGQPNPFTEHPGAMTSSSAP